MSEKELVSHEQNYASEIVEFYDAVDELKDPALRREYFETFTPADFIGFTQQAKGLICNGNADYLEPFDGETVSLFTHEVPDQRDKEDLLVQTWNTARSILQDRSLNDEDALTYAALVAAGGFLLTHPYMDGNGRTSRVISYVMINGITPDALTDLDDILQARQIYDDGKPVSADAWETTPPPAVREYAYDEPFPYQANAGLINAIGHKGKEASDKTLDNTDPVWKIFDSYNYAYALGAFFDNAGPEAKASIEPFIDRDRDGNVTNFRAADAVQSLVTDNEHGIGYAAQLLEAERWYRKEYVSNFLKAMANGKQDKSIEDLVERISQWPEDKMRKELVYKGRYPEKLQLLEDKHQARIDAVANYAVNGSITALNHYRLQHEVDSSIARRHGAKVK